MAAKQLECDVAIALEMLVEAGKKWDETDVESLLAVETAAVPAMEQQTVNLLDYDQLLLGGGGMNADEKVRLQCKMLRLSTMATVLDETIRRAEADNLPLAEFVADLLAQEIEARRERRIERLRRQSKLPPDKTFAIFDESRLPLRIQRQLPQLQAGDFVNRAENVLCFGLPGTGKSHLAAAIGHELVENGRSVLFVPTFKLVGRLLRAKQEYELERELRRLDKFEVIILDDIGYVQQSREEMEVLFTFLSERYERRSLIITSNLVFSEWGKIFKDPLTTAAAIDRVIHHSVIIEFGREIKSMRMEAAAKRLKRPLALDENVG